jgi:hypothetical protein
MISFYDQVLDALLLAGATSSRSGAGPATLERYSSWLGTAAGRPLWPKFVTISCRTWEGEDEGVRYELPRLEPEWSEALQLEPDAAQDCG